MLVIVKRFITYFVDKYEYLFLMIKVYKRPSQQLPDEYLDFIYDFADFITTKLPFESKVPIYLIAKGDREGCTTGQYDPAENKVYAVVPNRALVDILRTVAHEMTHMKQHQKGQIDPEKYTDIGGFAEGEANVKAGNFIKMYVKERGKERIYDI